MNSPIPTRLDKLRQKQNQLAEEIKKLEARETAQQRKDDTRRKIIAGALALHHMEKNPGDDFTKKLRSLLDEYVTKPRERMLFGMEPLPEPANDIEREERRLREAFNA